MEKTLSEGANTLDRARLAEYDFRDAISPIEAILESARAGKMFVLVDHENRENEGDLVIAAEFADAAAINFMAKYGRGLICLAMTGERIDELGLPLMAARNSSRHETAFTVSIEARTGVSTGISAADRARTVAVAIDPDKSAADICTPGHIFPLRARDGGVLVRAGHTEAAVDIARLAGLNSAGVICEIMREDGTMARLPDLIAFAQLHGIKIGAISDLIAYRHRHDNLVHFAQERTIKHANGQEWQLRTYHDAVHAAEHLVLIMGNIYSNAPVLLRMHALDPLHDIIQINEKDGKNDFQKSMDIIAEEGSGLLVLLRNETHKIDLNESQSKQELHQSQKLRQYGIGAQILASLHLSELILLTNSSLPEIIGLDAYGLKIIGTRKITP